MGIVCLRIDIYICITIRAIHNKDYSVGIHLRRSGCKLWSFFFEKKGDEQITTKKQFTTHINETTYDMYQLN
jgi:hypothetical protein